MALQGTLETFTVPDVLRLLATTRKTGLFALEGDRGTGRVWLDDGRISGVTSDREHGGDIDSVLFDLLRFKTGAFRFVPDEDAPDSSSVDDEVAGEVEQALDRAEQLLVEWREIESIIPSLDAWVRLIPDLEGDSVSINAALWQVLAVLGGGSTGRRVGADLDLGELDACRRLRDLVELGVAEVDTEFVSAEERMGLSLLTPSPMDPPPPPPPPAGEAHDQPEIDEFEIEPEADFDEPEPFTVELPPSASAADDEPVLVDHDLSNDEVATLSMDLASFVARPSDPEESYEVASSDEANDAAESVDIEMNGSTVDALDDADHGVAFGFDHEELDEVDDIEQIHAGQTDTVDAPDDSDEFLSQLANLSPKAAAAIEATNGAGAHELEVPVEAEIDDVDASGDLAEDGEEEINKNLLLKFLSSAKN